MRSVWSSLRRACLGISPEEITFTRRGFRGASEGMRARLEQVGATFVAGYHAALENRLEGLAPVLESIDSEVRGFAFEGAGMGLALLDSLTPWFPSRVGEFLRGAGEAHVYMAHVGTGWVWARWPFSRRWTKPNLSPLLCWLGFDGWGFHEGFFHWPKYLAGKPPPERLAGYERCAFDQGLGRSWWFVNGGNPELISESIACFPSERQPDLWSGIGLAATYAGIVGEAELRALCDSAGLFWPQMAQGASFAAKARQRAGNLTAYTDLAVQAFCGMSALEAAQLCDTTLENLPDETGEPAYAVWRRSIQSYFVQKKKLQPASLI